MVDMAEGRTRRCRGRGEVGCKLAPLSRSTLNLVLVAGALWLAIQPAHCQTESPITALGALPGQTSITDPSSATTPDPVSSTATTSSPSSSTSSSDAALAPAAAGSAANASLPADVGVPPNSSSSSSLNSTTSSNTSSNDTTATMMVPYFVRGSTTQPPTNAPNTPSEAPMEEPDNQLINATAFDSFIKVYAEEGGFNYSDPEVQCTLRSVMEPLLLDFEAENGGLYCPSYFDTIQCWRASPPGLVEMNCPEVYNRIIYNTNDTVTRLCLFNGSWGNNSLSNYDECTPIVMDRNEDPHASAIDILVYTGYCLSFTTLLGAFFILVYFKSLRCIRNYIHLNLVSSFLLLYIVFFLMIIITTWTNVGDNGWYCRLSATCVFYLNLTNFFWMFVEGLYLHTMVVRALSVRREKFWVYLLIGWGLPVVFAVTHAIAMTLIVEKEATGECLSKNEVDYIVLVPIMLVVLVNVCFMVHIMVILVTKLRASHSFETQQYRKGVRGIVVLLPLLGASYIMLLLEPSPDDPNVSTYLYRYFNAILQSTQGFFVAIIYVFMNQEVQNVIKRRFRRWQEEHTLPSRHYSRRGSNSRQNSMANNASLFRKASQDDNNHTLRTTVGYKTEPTDHVGNGKVPSFVQREELLPLQPVKETSFSSNEKKPLDWCASPDSPPPFDRETTALTAEEEPPSVEKPVEMIGDTDTPSDDTAALDDPDVNTPISVGSDEALIVHGNTPVMEQNLFIQDKLTRDNNNVQRNGVKVNGSNENLLAGQIGTVNGNRGQLPGEEEQPNASLSHGGNENNSNNTQLPCILKTARDRPHVSGKKHVAFVCPDRKGDLQSQFCGDSEFDPCLGSNQSQELAPPPAYTCSTIASDPWTREGDRSRWSPKILFKRPKCYGSPVSPRLSPPPSGDQGQNGRIKLPKSPAGTPV